MNTKTDGWRAGRGWLGAAVVGIAGLAAPSVLAQGDSKPAPKAAATEANDTIIFHSGRVVEGKIISETPTTVRVRVLSGGISAETEYNKSDILKISRAAQAGAAAEPAKADAPKAADTKSRDAKAAGDPSGAKKLYVIEMSGQLGEQITQTPVREAVRDAKKNNADYIICVLDSVWQENKFEKKSEDAVEGAFDELFRAEQIAPVFQKDIPLEWEKQPTVVYWVKKAMGGAAFLPLSCPNIYFKSDAKMGGIGNLTIMFGSTGDEVVRQKQYALRLKTAEGMAIVGGYAPEIVDAMADVYFVLSVEYVGGKPVYHERMPKPGSSEILLTDDANETEGRRDTDAALARGEGNDVLTLDAKLARDLLVSKGTVDTMDDLIFQLGVSRNYQMVDGQSKQITEGWKKGLEQAKGDLRRLWTEFREVQVQQPGDFQARTRARGTRKARIDEMERIIDRYEESLTRRWHQQYGIPQKPTLELIKVQLKLQQMADK